MAACPVLHRARRAEALEAQQRSVSPQRCRSIATPCGDGDLSRLPALSAARLPAAAAFNAGSGQNYYRLTRILDPIKFVGAQTIQLHETTAIKPFEAGMEEPASDEGTE